MKNLFKYEINESIAAKAAMNCVHKRLFKEHMGLPTPQKEVVLGEYDPYEWEYDDYGNEGKRKLIHKALVQAKLIQSEKEAWQFNNEIQQLLDKTNFPVSDAKSAAEFVKAYGQQIVGGTQEQEETTGNDKLAIAKQLMANYNPDTDEWEDPSVWILYAIQDHIGKQFLKMPKKEVKAWKKVIDETIAEYEFEKQHPAHYEHPEDEANLQSQLANAWDEGMEDDEDDYVPYENKFDETHNDLVDNLLRAVEHYFDYEEDVSGFYRFNYTEDQLGKAVEQILDKYGDFPSSNNFDKCYDWAEKHAEELMKILETGSLENTYEGHPEFGFSEQEEMEVTDAKHALAEMVADELRYPDGDLDKIYNIISDIIAKEGYSPDPDDYDDWLDEHFDEIHDLMVGGTISENEEEDYGMNDLRKWRDSLDLSNNNDDGDEEDYSDDSQGIEMIIDLMVTKNMISDGKRTRQIAKELIERKLNEEGMWIGEDAREVERFVEFFGEDMAEEIAHWRW